MKTLKLYRARVKNAKERMNFRFTKRRARFEDAPQFGIGDSSRTLGKVNKTSQKIYLDLNGAMVTAIKRISTNW